MIENSPIIHKTIYNSLSKLQRISSDGKFRVKSLRVKTVTNQMEDHITQKLGLPSIYTNQSNKKIISASPKMQQAGSKVQSNNKARIKSRSFKIIEKNYQEQLNKLGVTSQFLHQLYELKSQESQSKLNEHRYQTFVKNFALRLSKNKNLVIGQLGFGTTCLLYFLNWYSSWEGHISELDFSFTPELLKESKIQILSNLLEHDNKLMSIILCNCSLSGEQVKILFNIINTRQQVFSIDMSNVNSQSLNRFGEEIAILEDFFKHNQTVAIAKLNNTQLKKQGLQQIVKGISKRKLNPLKILSIASNYIVGSKLVCEYFLSLTKSGLMHLNISQNPLGDEFYKNLSVLKNTTIQELNLSATNMRSQTLYQFMQIIQQSKSLSILILDRNDFSHHWFGKIGQKLQTNNSLQFLSLNDCQIKTFMSIFQGLTQNKYLKRLHANNNAVDSDNQMYRRISDCFVYNKDLQQLKIRFCNLNDVFLIKMFQAIAQNKKLKVLDISENILQDNGAESILKMLDLNYKIQFLGIDKLQFSQHLRAKIQSKLIENKGVRQRQQLISLNNITNNIKAADKYSWQDVEKYEAQVIELEKKQSIIKGKVQKLQDMVEKKREVVINFTKELRKTQQEIQIEIKQAIKNQQQRVNLLEKRIKDVELFSQTVTDDKAREIKAIEALQNKIQVTNQRIKVKQNQLEELYRNQKYLQKKKKSKDRVQNSPKRKPSLHNHPKQIKKQG